MRFFSGIAILLLLVFSCNTKEKTLIDTSNIEVDFKVKRYDVDFYNATTDYLPQLKAKYPYLFPPAFTDSLAIAKMNDAQEIELFSEVQQQYSDFSEVEKELTSLFKHVKYYNPNFKSPNVVTMLTNITYEDRVIYADSLLFISLDNYLGKAHKFYVDYPNYIKQNMTKEHLIVDVAEALVNTQIPPTNKRRFVDKVIHAGKKMYTIDAYVPQVADSIKIGYSKDKYNWALANEEQIWMYFIDKELLFSTDTNLNRRFLDEAPFSKFYMEQDNLSPGRIGEWLGWRIVSSFMEKNDVSLQQMLKTDEDIIFKKSKYKPRN